MRHDLHTETERLALIKADEALEGAQQFNRGDCHLADIRQMIAKRLHQIEGHPADLDLTPIPETIPS